MYLQVNTKFVHLKSRIIVLAEYLRRYQLKRRFSRVSINFVVVLLGNGVIHDVKLENICNNNMFMASSTWHCIDGSTTISVRIFKENKKTHS